MGDIVIRIPDEGIQTYEEHMGGFTIRQWVGIALIVVVCGGFSVYANMHGIGQCSFLLNVVFGGLVACVCFVKVNNMNFEKIFPYIKRSFVIYYTVLPKRTKNEQTIEVLMSLDKAYRKKKQKADEILKTASEYLLTQKQRQELTWFREYRNRFMRELAQYLEDEKPSEKEVRKIGKYIRQSMRG